MRKTATAVFIIAAIAGAPAAFAQMGPGGHHGMGGHEEGGPMFQDYDTNGDKVVSKEEFEAKSAVNFKEADVGHKGAITFEEFQVYADKQMEKRRLEMMKHHFDTADTNHDGKISADEYKAAADKMFTLMDANHDGKLSAEDRALMQEKMRERMKNMPHDGMKSGDMPH